MAQRLGVAFPFLVLCWLSGVTGRLPQGKLSATDIYTVCMTNFLPYQTCVVGDTTPTNFSGYGSELFHRLAARMLWTYGQDYTFVCLDFIDVITDLVDPTGRCDVASSALLVSSQDQKSGIKFGYPDYHTGQGVMVYATSKKTNQWLFLAPFSWEVWVFLFVAAFCVGVFVQLVEKIMTPARTEGEEYEAGHVGYGHMVWSAGAQVVNASEPMSVVSIPSRIITFVWCFVILLIVAMYTGNAAAILTASNVDVAVQSIDDLRGQSWGAYVGTLGTMHRNGWFPTKIYDGGLVSETQFLEDLKTGVIQGVVWDFGFVDYITATSCNYVKVGGFLTEESRALAWWQNASDALISQFNGHVLDLEESTDLKHLHDTFIAPPPASCNEQEASQITKVTFREVSGLWIVLGATILFSLALAVISRYCWRPKLQPILTSTLAETFRKTGNSKGKPLVPTMPVDSFSAEMQHGVLDGKEV
ncbi:glutamate receptor [Klebsormidium nitens]|uniref:Glutamate receptor n=1 Tax=Klebsormidium nitens TaxID=105231 RepID=A0A1Y1IPU6_KLENI|nr:glutamate receptor [Klebsormidium nitens]|eukprot:GAQ91241.1 glutamate receptor [Klebsormidium nitens]